MLRQQFRQVLKATLFSSALALVFSGPVWSCGPHYPDSIFALGDEAVLNAPALSFSHELKEILKRFEIQSSKQKEKGESFYEEERTLDAGLRDLQAALKNQSGVTKARQGELETFYKKLRKQFQESPWSTKKKAFPAVPGDLPADFHDYLRGAIAYRNGTKEKARVFWQAILDRKAPGPRYRHTWAAFMLGKSFKDKNPKRAILYFQKTRRFAAQRKLYPDSLGLSAASLGWEAYSQLRLKNYKDALKLYVRHLATEHYSAEGSIRQTCFQALQSSDQNSKLGSLAEDDLCRALVTAYVVSHIDHDSRFGLKHSLARRWLEILQAKKQKIQKADKLAWTFYRLGQMKDAKAWLSRQTQETALSVWLSAKLHLRDGEVKAAIKDLDKALGLFPLKETWVGVEDPQLLSAWGLKPRVRVHGELGVLELGQGQPLKALHHFYQAGYWWDAAYVAESVLTAEELKSYVDKHCPNHKDEDCLRYLLGRRLARSKAWKEARVYLPAAERKKLDLYLQSMSLSKDATKSRRSRNEALWKAAQILRADGMELIGTELSPDWFALGGNYTAASVATLRKKNAHLLTAPLSMELKRVAEAKRGVTKRFHYRYKAADLAWKAALSMPDQDPRTAELLCKAGTWLKYRDPKAADRFYKALVIRCGQTELGRLARKKRWFP